LISLSPLRKAPPKLLQQLPVRTSNGVAPAFLLSFPSSPGFGSIAGERRPVRTTLSLCLRLTAEASPPHDHLHVHYTKGTRERRSALRVCSSSNFTGAVPHLRPFPHGTCSLSIIDRTPALGTRSSLLRALRPWRALLSAPARRPHLRHPMCLYGGLSPSVESGVGGSGARRSPFRGRRRATVPPRGTSRCAYSAFARHY